MESGSASHPTSQNINALIMPKAYMSATFVARISRTVVDMLRRRKRVNRWGLLDEVSPLFASAVDDAKDADPLGRVVGRRNEENE